ncbi:MAG TPA: response regulator [Flavobacteriales bacterium]|nr:DNA-binding response regulator [Flavobacteriales bacterium]HRE75788.1 response regulator [Flavobacteriales bacterium]HRE97605.1 response regulator [Flavobacteriales bacterium]HRJ36188.1 response regulator [Flavobacteriales bacterium]HRJ37153.1 response regulator [Flavobacteriales bacterium]
MQSLRAIIIDDEERARHTLKVLLQDYCPNVEILAEAGNVPDAVLAINKHKPDLIFLDIEMPEYNGFELMGFFREIDFDIIFVTAYSEYALRAFEVSATDYLLKPVEIDSLKNAIDKIHSRQSRVALKQRLDLLKDTVHGEEIRKIALPMSDGLLFVEVADLVLVEADGAYSYVHLRDGSKILVSKKLKFFEDILNGRMHFFRPHRSYLININYIKKYHRGENNLVMDNAQSVAISRDRKTDFDSLLKEMRLSV